MRLAVLFLAVWACTGPTKDSAPPGTSLTDDSAAPADDTASVRDDTASADADGDGVAVGDDCDDTDPEVGAARTWYADEDGDGYGDAATEADHCDPPAVLVLDGTDCDDSRAAVHPGADEADCTDPTDYNCDGSVSYADADSDGNAACADCDDANADIYPGAPEHCDGVDEDCDGSADNDPVDPASWYSDVDGDGYGDPTEVTLACSAPGTRVATADDCDDTRGGVNPGATETCNTAYDDDCDGDVQDRDATACVEWFEDLDADGFGGVASLCTCDAPAGYGARAYDDCDDADPGVHPDATEDCLSLVDDNCDGDTNGVDALGCEPWYLDADGDGSAGSEFSCACVPSGVYTGLVPEDCDDSLSTIYPSAPEHCDDTDEDCDGNVDEDATDLSTWFLDADGDGYGDDSLTRDSCAAPEGYVAVAGDCDDIAAAVHPAADERCSTSDDDNCDGETLGIGAADCTVWYADADADGHGEAASQCACAADPNYSASDDDDCDDGNAAISPSAGEDCATPDDDNCDGDTNSMNAIGCDDYFADADADGYGSAHATCWCAPSGSYTASDATDCDDTDTAINPGAAEICNDGADNNCDDSAGACGPVSGPLASADLYYWGEANEDFSAYDLAMADFNGDGDLDLIIGSPSHDSGGTDLGAAHVVLGGPDVRSGSLASEIRLTNTYASGGLYTAGHVANAGDVNADGYEDLLIGGDGINAHLVLGSATPTSLSLTASNARYTVSTINSELNDLTGVGDVNGDGYDDLLFGDYFDDYGSDNSGTIFLVYGSATPSSTALTAADVRFWGPDRYDYAGYTIAGPGDVDGDSVADLLIGSDGADVGGSDSGGAWFLSGATADSNLALSAADAFFAGEAVRDEAAFVAGAGDINQDGYADFAVGAPYNADGGVDAGAVYVVYGALSLSDQPLSASPQFTGVAGDAAGTDLSPAGDQDGDSYDDLLVGGVGYGSAGGAWLVLGGPSLASTDLASAGAVYAGESSNDRAGTSVASGDHNADGLPDLFIGAITNDDGGTDRGTTYMIFGQGL